MKLHRLLQYKLLKLEHYLRLNIGFDGHGFQLFALHVIPAKNIKHEYLLVQLYHPEAIHKLFGYYILIEG